MPTKALIPVVALILFLASCQKPNQEQSTQTSPNILFLFADDQAYHMISALGKSQVKTPNLDRLLAGGMTFTHCFNQGSWSGAVCVVSRAMLNSGRYIYHAREDINQVPLWGETLGEHGYSTFLTGKWHNGNKTALKSFQQAKSIGKGMFETRGGTKGPGYYRPSSEQNSWQADDTTLLGHWSPKVKDIVVEDSVKKIGEEYTLSQHTSELYTDRALDFLDEHISNKKDEPFFLYLAYNAPHDPRQAPTEYLDMYPLESIELPPNYLPEHPFDQGERNTLRDEILGPFPRTEEVVKTHLREYYAIISHMDAQIGRVLDDLEAKGLMENTYIVFSADHGLAVGSHGLLGKQNQYDHSVRMPLIISGPGIDAGSQSDALVYLQSMFATSCEWAGIPVPDHVEFSSLNPIINGESEESQEYIFGSYKNFQRMVRSEKYKLILYPHIDRIQLFDMLEDPYELNDLSQKVEYKDTIQSLFQKLQELQIEVGDTLSLNVELASS